MKNTFVRQLVIFQFLILVKQDDKLQRKRKHLLSATHSLRAAFTVPGCKEKIEKHISTHLLPVVIFLIGLSNNLANRITMQPQNERLSYFLRIKIKCPNLHYDLL